MTDERMDNFIVSILVTCLVLLFLGVVACFVIAAIERPLATYGGLAIVVAVWIPTYIFIKRRRPRE
jgi:drug/metabolite transporter superfamily protein YnfA